LRLFKYKNIKITRLLEGISRKMVASDCKCGVFIKISIIFEDDSREIEAFLMIARLFEYLFSGIEAFLK
jgi:hypothetical protein